MLPHSIFLSVLPGTDLKPTSAQENECSESCMLFALIHTLKEKSLSFHSLTNPRVLVIEETLQLLIPFAPKTVLKNLHHL